MRKKMRRFTLAELLVVVAIIALLTAIAIPVFFASRKKSKETVCEENRAILKEQVTVAYLTKTVKRAPRRRSRGKAPSIPAPSAAATRCGR